MPTAERPPRGPGRKPAAKKRSDTIELRVSPLERAAIEANAEESGISVSELLRQRGAAEGGHAAAPKRAKPGPTFKQRPETPDPSFDTAVEQKMRAMPWLPVAGRRKAAEREVRRERA